MHHELQTENLVNSFAGVWKRVVTDPRGFFQEMPVSGGLARPLIFLAICLAVSGLGLLLLGWGWLALWFAVRGLLFSFVYAAVFMIVGRQIFAGVGDYEATYRVVAYAAAPVALFWIPIVKHLAALYLLFLLIVGLERVHAFDAVKAVLTLLIAAFVIMVLAWVLGVHAGWTPLVAARTGAYGCV